MEPVKSTRELLAEYAVLLNSYGVASSEASAYLAKHGDNEEFQELARLSEGLKVALSHE